MKELELGDLNNPDRISAILLTNGNSVELGENQGFQEYPNSIELWEKPIDRCLFKVKRWTTRSIAATERNGNKESWVIY